MQEGMQTNSHHFLTTCDLLECVALVILLHLFRHHLVAVLNLSSPRSSSCEGGHSSLGHLTVPTRGCLVSKSSPWLPGLGELLPLPILSQQVPVYVNKRRATNTQTSTQWQWNRLFILSMTTRLITSLDTPSRALHVPHPFKSYTYTHTCRLHFTHLLYACKSAQHWLAQGD